MDITGFTPNRIGSSPVPDMIQIYDFNHNTYDMNHYPYMAIPFIYINGSLGENLSQDIDNYTIDYTINQTYEEQVTSRNVIGEIEGEGIHKNKVVIISCLYDSWWCQGTADSAIGIGIILSLAKYIQELYDQGITPLYTIKFIAFAGEEAGIRGAHHYQYTHSKDKIVYVIDLNQLGFKQSNDRGIDDPGNHGIELNNSITFYKS